MMNINHLPDQSLFSKPSQRIFLAMHKEKDQAVNALKPKPDLMPELKIMQLKQESEEWKRLLNFMVDENIHLKHRLAEILRNISDTPFLEQAEEFQSRFLKKDMLISLLRDDIADMESSLVKNRSTISGIGPEIKNKLKKLRHNIAQTERQFNKLKMDFNTYMSERL